MRKPLVVGNWKMYGSELFVADLLSQLKHSAPALLHVELVVCPAFVFLPQARTFLSGTSIKWGAQNMYHALEGAYTGEISPMMLQELKCDYVILGHSERRHGLGESNEQIAAKFCLAGECGLKPILCVGETREQRERGETFAIIAEQLHAMQPKNQDIVIAYEPVWAIGTGLAATPEQAQAVHAFIRTEVAKINKLLAEKVRILYGGSIKQNNAAPLFAMPDIDGGLIGGASLNATEFLEIAKLCN